MFQRAHTAAAVTHFKRAVEKRLNRARADLGRDDVALPVALLLLIDKANGGDATAEELSRRFHLLDRESREVIDFHFAGWQRSGDGKSIEFSLQAFEEFRTALRRAGVTHFGGNADLILVDAIHDRGGARLALDEAIHLDLSAAVKRTGFPSLGAFLQTLIDVAESIGAGAGSGDSPVFAISDHLGISIGRRSLMQFILDKWGAMIGAGALSDVAVRRVGNRVSLLSF